MKIRRANEKDMEGINRLLCQVLAVHHEGRPDLFQKDTKKYTDEELRALLGEDKRPVFVAVDDKEQVMAYAFLLQEEECEAFSESLLSGDGFTKENITYHSEEKRHGGAYHFF